MNARRLEMQAITAEGSSEDLERLTQDVLEQTLGLDQVLIEAAYAATQPAETVTKRVRDLADRAVTKCADENRQIPDHLATTLKTVAQLELPFESQHESVMPCVLIIDSAAERLSARVSLFCNRKYRVETTTSASDGLARLEGGGIQLAIVDYTPSTDDDMEALLQLQRFNLQIPIMNITAWSVLFRSEERKLNRELLRLAARLFGRPMPNRGTDLPDS